MEPRPRPPRKPNRPTRQYEDRHWFFTVRTALIVLLAVLTALGTAALFLAAHTPAPVAAASSVAAFAGAVRFFDWLIE
jgi:hypothetical protein